MSTNPENKVQFGLKSVHYAVLTETETSSGTTYSWGTPVPIKGAVNLSLSPEGETNKFHADNIAYYISQSNNGYSGDLEVAKIPDAMLSDIWGMTKGSTSGVITELANAETVYFALLFQIDGDASNSDYVMYKCSATRPNINSETIAETKEPVTQTIALTCIPLANGKVSAHTTADASSTVKTGWYSSVFVEA